MGRGDDGWDIRFDTPQELNNAAPLARAFIISKLPKTIREQTDRSRIGIGESQAEIVLLPLPEIAPR